MPEVSTVSKKGVCPSVGGMGWGGAVVRFKERNIPLSGQSGVCDRVRRA